MKLIVKGGTKDFSEFLKHLGGEVYSSFCVQDALGQAIALSADAIFILPDYENGENSLEELSESLAEELFTLINGGKTKVYIENYPSFDYRDCFPLGLQAREGVSPIGRLSLCPCNGMELSVGSELLQKRQGCYIPSAIHTSREIKVLCEAKNCIGVRKVVKSDLDSVSPVLIRCKETLYFSQADLTRLISGRIYSFGAWQRFYSALFSKLLSVPSDSVSTAFADVYSRTEINGASDDNLLTRMEDAVSAAVDWHMKSGIMLDGGKRGVYEMIRSFDHRIAKNLRGDSSMITAALFMAAGKYFGRTDYIDTAEAIGDYLLERRELQITEGKNKGLFKWFVGSHGMGPTSVYVSDCSRIGNALIALYRLSGKEKYYISAKMLGEAFLSLFNGKALFPACYLDYTREDIDSLQSKHGKCSPEFYDSPMIFMKNMYETSGEEKYRAQIIRTATALAEAYPNFDTVTSHSDNFTYGRLLGALSCAQYFENGVWSGVIDSLLSYFDGKRHSEGGFYEGRAYYDDSSLAKDVEFAVGLGESGESIADFVYCQNTMLYSLGILCKCDGEFNKELALSMHKGLVDFILRTQISSPDPKTNGVWMRAFDMENMEYYGCDKDFAWGPYCILTGWVTGMIPLCLLDLLGTPNMF